MKIFKKIGKKFLCFLLLLILLMIITDKIYLLIEKNSIEKYGHTVQVNNKNMNVVEAGEGNETIVLLPGFGTTAPGLDFRPLIQELAMYFHVVAIEPFGYGQSDLTNDTRSIENISAEIHTCLLNLGINKYILMAHSISGAYGQYYMNLYAGEVTAYIGLDSSLPAQYKYMTPSSTALYYLLLKAGVVRAACQFIPAIRDSIAPENYPQALKKQMKAMFFQNFYNETVRNENDTITDNFIKADEFSLPPNLPVLFILASETVENIAWWKELHTDAIKKSAHSEILVLEGDHYIYHTHAKQIAEKVLLFTGQN